MKLNAFSLPLPSQSTAVRARTDEPVCVQSVWPIPLQRSETGFCWFLLAKNSKNQFPKLVFVGFCTPKPAKTSF
jgi:hypothetical protein